MSLRTHTLTHLNAYAAVLLFPLAPLSALDYQTFITGAVPAIPESLQAPELDADKDGVPNGVEFLVDGMNPAVADSERFPAPVEDGDAVVFSVPLRPDAEVDASFEVLDLADFSWVAADPGEVAGTATTLTLKVAGDSADRALARLALVIGGSAGEINNPVARAYPAEYDSGEYAWTDAFRWDVEFDVTDFGAIADGSFADSTGTDNHAAFTAAMAAAAQAGGGTVRVPAGVFYIGDHLLIPPQVAIRGVDLPEGSDSATEGTLNPPSKLVFPKYDPVITGSGSVVRGGAGAPFKRIWSDALVQIDNTDTDPIDWAAHSTIALVNLDINRASVILDVPTVNPLKTGGNWSGRAGDSHLPPFLREDGVGKNFVILGVRSNNVAVADGADGVNSGVPQSWQNAWQRNPWRFNANFRIASGGNALVANSSANDLSAQNIWAWGRTDESPANYVDDSYEQIGYIARRHEGNSAYALNRPGMATFRQTSQYGISVNGLFFFSKAGLGGAPDDAWGNNNGWYGSPTSAPWLFREGHVVRDNFVFAMIGAKIEASGQGLKVNGNVIRDVSRKVAFLRNSGINGPDNGDEVLSRGVLMGGWDVESKFNDIVTTKHSIGHPETGRVTGFVSNDGEGLMMDNTTTVIRGWDVSHNLVNANIFAFKSKGIEDVTAIGNDFYPRNAFPITSNGIPFWLETNPTNQTGFPFNNVRIEDNTNLPGTIRLIGSRSGSGTGNTIKNNEAAGSRTIEYTDADYGPTDISGNTGFTLSPR